MCVRSNLLQTENDEIWWRQRRGSVREEKRGEAVDVDLQSTTVVSDEVDADVHRGFYVDAD